MNPDRSRVATKRLGRAVLVLTKLPLASFDLFVLVPDPWPADTYKSEKPKWHTKRGRWGPKIRKARLDSKEARARSDLNRNADYKLVNFSDFCCPRLKMLVLFSNLQNAGFVPIHLVHGLAMTRSASLLTNFAGVVFVSVECQLVKFQIVKLFFLWFNVSVILPFHITVLTCSWLLLLKWLGEQMRWGD
jgi:hypothetical protein